MRKSRRRSEENEVTESEKVGGRKEKERKLKLTSHKNKRESALQVSQILKIYYFKQLYFKNLKI